MMFGVSLPSAVRLFFIPSFIPSPEINTYTRRGMHTHRQEITTRNAQQLASLHPKREYDYQFHGLASIFYTVRNSTLLETCPLEMLCLLLSVAQSQITILVRPICVK